MVIIVTIISITIRITIIVTVFYPGVLHLYPWVWTLNPWNIALNGGRVKGLGPEVANLKNTNLKCLIEPVWQEADGRSLMPKARRKTGIQSRGRSKGPKISELG